MDAFFEDSGMNCLADDRLGYIGVKLVELIAVSPGERSINTRLNDRDRQTDRQTYRQTDRQRVRERQRQTDRQTETQRKRDTEREYGRFIHLGYCPS